MIIVVSVYFFIMYPSAIIPIIYGIDKYDLQIRHEQMNAYQHIIVVYNARKNDQTRKKKPAVM